MSTWPPKEGLSTPSISRKDAVLSTSASTRVNAPAAKAFEAIVLVSEYPKWNLAFAPEAKIVSQPSEHAGDEQRLHKGTVAKFFFNIGDGKPASGAECTIVDISTPEAQSEYVAKDVLGKDATYHSDLGTVYRLVWTQSGGGLNSERFHEIVVLGENECEVRTWACYKGMVARGIKWSGSGSKLEDKMNEYVKDVKKYAEEKAVGAA